MFLFFLQISLNFLSPDIFFESKSIFKAPKLKYRKRPNWALLNNNIPLSIFSHPTALKLPNNLPPNTSDNNHPITILILNSDFVANDSEKWHLSDDGLNILHL